MADRDQVEKPVGLIRCVRAAYEYMQDGATPGTGLGVTTLTQQKACANQIPLAEEIHDLL